MMLWGAVTLDTVGDFLIIADSYRAADLQAYCFDLVALNLGAVLESRYASQGLPPLVRWTRQKKKKKLIDAPLSVVARHRSLEGVPEHVLAQLEEHYRAHYVPAYVQAFRMPYERAALVPLDGDGTLRPPCPQHAPQPS